MFCDFSETQHWFDQKAADWGFSEMIRLNKLRAREGFMVNGEVVVTVKVDVLQVEGKVDVSEESSPVVETVDVNGFQVLTLQVSNCFLVLQDLVFCFILLK